jgi:hypothetical protein
VAYRVVRLLVLWLSGSDVAASPANAIDAAVASAAVQKTVCAIR